MAYYVDTSAAVKLVVEEPESPALSAWLAPESRDIVSSDLLRTELLRVARRGGPETVRQAREVLDSITLFTVSTATFEAAGRLDPVGLRSLDAVHLTAALEFGDDLEGVVTYDDPLRAATEHHGLMAVAPGAAFGGERS